MTDPIPNLPACPSTILKNGGVWMARPLSSPTNPGALTKAHHYYGPGPGVVHAPSAHCATKAMTGQAVWRLVNTPTRPVPPSSSTMLYVNLRLDLVEMTTTHRVPNVDKGLTTRPLLG